MMSVLPKANYRFNTISIKIPVTFFAPILKIHIEYQGTQNRQNNLEKEESSSWFQNLLH